jgi:hypothetical protein
MLDGPQGLAMPGKSLRECERQAKAAGKTPDTRPHPNRPYANFINSSLDLFLALHQAGISVDPPDQTKGVCEVYPGHLWSLLAAPKPQKIPQKNTEKGRLARKCILEAVGIAGLPELPTHDENDACVGAVMAAAADGKIPGFGVQAIGLPLMVDQGLLREGRMIIPKIMSDSRRAALAAALSSVPVLPVPEESSLDLSGSVHERAKKLLSRLIDRANRRQAQVCTYAWAYRHLFNIPFKNFSQAFAQKVIQVAQKTPPMHVRGLGAVRLDCFIVAKATGRPSGGHWDSANYTPQDWDRVLGRATVLD